MISRLRSLIKNLKGKLEDGTTAARKKDELIGELLTLETELPQIQRLKDKTAGVRQFMERYEAIESKYLEFVQKRDEEYRRTQPRGEPPGSPREG